MIRALSLFANVGIAETYLKEAGIEVMLANEIEKQRADFYSFLYPNVDMIVGDITNKNITNEIIEKSNKLNIDMIIATPPCQGMSTAGKKDKNDSRNFLITYAVDIILKVKPKYVFLENVPQQLKTKIMFNNKSLLIPEYLNIRLGKYYNFNGTQLINSADYGVPQIRERAIFLLTRKDLKMNWNFPPKERNITLEEAIGNLPSIDPFIKDVSEKELLQIFPDYYEKEKEALKISKWHCPPKHIYRQVYSLMHTPTGNSAFENIDKFKPRTKDGKIVKGFKNTYKRQSWDRPGYTITMYNRTIGSQDNVHPGRYIGKDNEGYDLYSDARVFTIYELMIIMSLPTDWNIPQWATDHFIRQVIGEGIPPLLVKKIMMEIRK